MTIPNHSSEIKKIEEDIRRLDDLKKSGSLPPDLADTSITALKEKMASYRADLEGGGAIAQGAGAIAVGKGAVYVNGDFQGSLYLGEKPEDDDQAIKIYRRMIIQTASSLPLRGVDVGASDPTLSQKAIGLVNVYVDLDTTTEQFRSKTDSDFLMNKEGTSTGRERISVLDAVKQNRSIVLLGDPGSGKSTFVNFLAQCLAAHSLEPDAGWLKYLDVWPSEESGLLPVVIVLREFTRSLADNIPKKADVSYLWNFIEQRLKAQNLESAIGPIRSALETGNAILLFDGLDEVPTPDQRVFVRDMVRSFISRYSNCRYLITCRKLSYQHPATGKLDLRLDEIPSFEIAEFDDKKISRFVDAWFSELTRLGTVPAEEQDTLSARLGEAVQRPDLKPLASNPLLLTVMALVQTHKGRLPDARALLYEETIDILLWRWEQIKLGGKEDASLLRQYLLEAGRTDVDLKRVIWELAFETHSVIKGDEKDDILADINEHHLIKILSALKCDDEYPNGDLNWANKVVNLMKMRAGLLLERQPGIFTFPHRTFQEYLAGAHLATHKNFATVATNLAPLRALWREVILYAVGKLVYVSGDLDKPLALVAELCSEKMADDDLAWWQTWLAGDILQEIGLKRVNDSSFGRDLLNRIRLRLKELLEKGKLAPRERNNAGITLSLLGDPRFNADLWYLPTDELVGFTLIPAGKFTMRSNNIENNEKRENDVNLPDFWMAKYPVSVQQFRAFTESNQYPFDRWQYNRVSTQPVIGVTWYDVLAYVRWLNVQLQILAESRLKNQINYSLWSGLAAGKLQAILPSEAEWEKAACGIDRRIYPWGAKFDPNNANTRETNLGEPSVVGIFPYGASPYGLLDMSGNIWEWTRSIYDRFSYDPSDKLDNLLSTESRMLCGGSFYLRSGDVRCVDRLKCGPDYRSADLGFRVVISQIPQ